MKTLNSIVCILLASHIFCCAQIKYNDIVSATFEYSKIAANDDFHYWDISFNKKEIQQFKKFTLKYNLIKDYKPNMFIGCYKGILKTVNGNFELLLGTEKVADQTYLIRLRPINNEKLDEFIYYRLDRKNGYKIDDLIDKLAKKKTLRKPDRVTHR